MLQLNFEHCDEISYFVLPHDYLITIIISFFLVFSSIIFPTTLNPVRTWAINESLLAKTSRYQTLNNTYINIKSRSNNVLLTLSPNRQNVIILGAKGFAYSIKLTNKIDKLNAVKVSPNGQFIYSLSNTGWLSKFDLLQMKTIHKIKIVFKPIYSPFLVRENILS